MKRQIPSLYLVLIAMLFSITSFSQLSPSGQVNFKAPSVLSGCGSDTVFVEFTNTKGPICPAPGAGGGNLTVEVDIPGDTVIAYKPGSVNSLPAGATEVSYVSKKLTLTIPVPSYGSTVRAWFLVQSKCNVSTLSPLPFFVAKAIYPVGYNTASETWNSTKMNTGVGNLLITDNVGSATQIRAFDDYFVNDGFYLNNNGYGNFEEIKVTIVKSDSLYNYIGPGGKIPWIYRYNSQQGSTYGVGVNDATTAISQQASAFPDYTETQNGNGTTTYKFTFKGATFGTDNKFTPGESFYLPSNYLKSPFTCNPDMVMNWSFEPVCLTSSSSCSAPAAFDRNYKVSAGTPILGAADVVAQQYNGCSPKSISYNYKNTAIPVAGKPEVGSAFNVTYSMPFGNPLTITNLKVNGVTIPASMIEEDLSKPVSQVTLKIKDFNTLSTLGLKDLDGDGKFDELQAGETLAVNFDYSVPCGLTCGANFLYNINAITTYTDFCGKLKGNASTPIYEFGLQQINAVLQTTPLPDLVAAYNAANGTSVTTLTTGNLSTVTGSFGFNYKSKNIDMSSSIAKLRLNYAKDYEIVQPIKFLGVTHTLSDFTAIGTGRIMPNGSLAATFAPNKTTDKDSALEYTLTAAEVALLFDGNMDSVLYSMTHITCDSFQTQKNNNGFQIIFEINPTCTPAPSCKFDLACGKGFGLKLNEGCGTVPCYINNDTLYRKSIVGSTTDALTTPVTLPMTDENKFYTGDTLTHILKSHLSGNYSPYATIGSFAGQFGAIGEVMQFAYDIPGYIPNTHPLIWAGGRVKIVDSAAGGLVVADFPMDSKDFYSWQAKGNTKIPTTNLIGDNIGASDPYYGAFSQNGISGLGAYYSIYASWDNLGVYTLDNPRYYSPNSYLYFSMARQDKGRMLDYYELHWEEAAVRAGYSGLNISSKDLYIFTETNWKVNPDFPHTNTGGIDFSTYTRRYGDGVAGNTWGTQNISRCGVNQTVASVATKEISVKDAGAILNSTCGLRIDNKLFLKSQTGNWFLDEVRVPYKLDSVTIDLPAEYYIATNTAAPSFIYNNGTQITAAAPNYVGSTTVAGTFGSQTGHVKFTGALADGEFNRMTDASGNTVTDNLSYYISNVGTDNTINNSYRFPVKYFLKEENGTPFILVDTLSIVEGKGDLTVKPLGGSVKIADGGTCAKNYMDLIVNNDSIFTAGYSLINVFGTANTQVVKIEDISANAKPFLITDTGTVAPNVKFALLGSIAGGAAGQKIIRVYFNTTSCKDSIKVVSNFGCNYPAGNNIYTNSTTKDSSYIVFEAIKPQMLIGAIVPKTEIVSLCDQPEMVFEITNVQSPNLFNINAGFKLAPNMKLVPGSIRANSTNAYTTTAYDLPVTAGITSSGLAGDSLLLNVSTQLLLNGCSYGSSNYYFPGCGLAGPNDVSTDKSCDGNAYASFTAVNRVRIKFKVEFTACPTETSSAVTMDATATNFCGLVTSSKAVANVIYIGASAAANNYSCSTSVAKKIAICAKPGETQAITDTLIIKNEGGFATSGPSSATDSLVITVPVDLANFTLSNFKVNGIVVPLGLNAEGKYVLRTTLPAGIAVGANFNLPISYNLSPLVPNLCSIAPSGTCPELAFFTEFKSVVSLSCAASGLTCTSLAVVSRGQGMSVRDITCCASLGNKVWLDEGAGGGTPKDGIQNGTEPGVAGVPVNLYQNGADGLPGTNDDVLIASTITDAYGIYNFDDLQPSTGPTTLYNVRVTPPSNYSLTTQTNTTDDNNTIGSSITGSDVNPLGVSYSIDLSAGENNPNIDAGLIFQTQLIPNSIGDKVWFDANGDGNNDGGAAEPGVAGVTVTLYDAATGNVVAITTTDANGNYLFNNLPPNTNYQVGFNAPAGTTLTTGGTLSIGNTTTNSDANPITGLTTVINTGAPGTQITGVDAGIKNDPKGAIGDFVWNDLNNNGIQDPGEPGVPGVIMKLYGPGPDGVIGGADDILIATTTTNSNGYYVFNNLDPAKYFIVATPVAGYTNSAANQGTDDTKDSDFSTGTGAYAGNYVSGLYTLLNIGAGVTRDMTVDLGIHNNTPNLNTIGNKVWNDINKDGKQDASEAGVPNVTVRLLNSTGAPVNNPATGKPYVVTTDANGNYKFVDLPDGNYIVEFANLPTGFVFTTKDAVGSGNPGSGTDTDTDSDANTATGRTGVIDLDAAGANGSSVNIVSVDAGITQGTPAGTASLGNRVWYDVDNNGLQNAGEFGVVGVKCELLDGFGNVVNVPGTSTPYVIYTNALGEYLFTGLPAGDYKVRFSNFPAGYTSSPADAGTNDAIDADANFTGISTGTTTATTGVYTLQTGEDNLTVDMGIVPPTTGNNNSLGNFVWSDLDADGQQDAGEPGVQGVTVTLYNNGPDGLPGTPDDIVVGVTTTDNNGGYGFVGLPDGNYNVKFSNLPAGYTFTTKDAAGSNAINGSDASTLSGRTGTISLDPTGASAAGINDPNVDAGIISTRAALGNYVWLDTNGDGIQDANEKGISGVTVILYAADGVTVVASTITDADGKYYFGNLIPDTYIVGFGTLPNGLIFTQQNTPGDNGNNTNSDADPITGKTGPIVLVAGETDLTVDAGLKPFIPASVGNFVWIDKDGDGVQDAGEPGLPGILVTLKDNLGNVVGTAITDGNGKYLIDNVKPGTGFTITFSNLPSTAIFTGQNTSGSTAATGSDANSSGETASFDLVAGQYLPDIDAGIQNVQILPIKLLSFTALPNGIAVSIDWKVDNQDNVSKYEVLYSTDGVSFRTVIANVAATANTAEAYNIMHSNVVTGINYYRIRITEKDGSVGYSEIRKVNFGKAGLITVYPNPAKTVINITLTGAMINQAATITLLSAEGKIVSQSNIAKTGQTETINVSMLANGTYFIKVMTATEVIVRTIQVNK